MHMRYTVHTRRPSAPGSNRAQLLQCPEQALAERIRRQQDARDVGRRAKLPDDASYGEDDSAADDRASDGGEQAEEASALPGERPQRAVHRLAHAVSPTWRRPANDSAVRAGTTAPCGPRHGAPTFSQKIGKFIKKFTTLPWGHVRYHRPVTTQSVTAGCELAMGVPVQTGVALAVVAEGGHWRSSHVMLETVLGAAKPFGKALKHLFHLSLELHGLELGSRTYLIRLTATRYGFIYAKPTPPAPSLFTLF